MACWIVLLPACSSVPLVADGTQFSNPDGSRTAVVQQGRVSFDGKPGDLRYDGIVDSGVTFSSDGKRAAYIGVRGQTFFLVVDGREYGPFDQVARAGVLISPRARRVALSLVIAGRWHLWLDGQLSGPFEGLAHGHPLFSDDESHVAYAALRGKNWSLVVDGVEQVLGEAIHYRGFGFTSGGEVYATYLSAEGYRLRLGQATSQAFDTIHLPGVMLSPGRRSLAFIASKGERMQVCVDLVCGRPHRLVGTRFQADASIFGQRYTTVGAVAFSPDERHHAYVANNEAASIVIDDSTAVELAKGQQVEWMRFDDSSQVLMVRLAGAPGLLTAMVPGVPRHAATHTMPQVAMLDIKVRQSEALVFVDQRYAGLSPLRVPVTAGRHEVRIQAPGRAGARVEVNAKAGEEVALELAAPPDPVRGTVHAAIATLNDSKLPLSTQAKPADLLRGRLLTSMPPSEDIIGVALYAAGGDALVFGESAIYVFNEFSSTSATPRSHVIPYLEFARAPRATVHRAFEVTLTPNAVTKVAGMSIAKDRLIEFVESLRTQMALTLGQPATRP